MTDDSESLIAPCPICHSKRVDAVLKAPGFGNDIYLRELHPGRSKNTIVTVRWCKKCGNIELNAKYLPDKPSSIPEQA